MQYDRNNEGQLSLQCPTTKAMKNVRSVRTTNTVKKMTTNAVKKMKIVHSADKVRNAATSHTVNTVQQFSRTTDRNSTNGQDDDNRNRRTDGDGPEERKPEQQRRRHQPAGSGTRRQEDGCV